MVEICLDNIPGISVIERDRTTYKRYLKRALDLLCAVTLPVVLTPLFVVVHISVLVALGQSLDDPRHTRLGRVLRKLSIDELPQLWNVIRGDMSLVGPRPEFRAIAEQHGILDHPRHEVRPGMTGPWQVSTNRPGYVHENVHLDAQYVQDLTYTTDIKIILRTFLVVIRASGQ